MSDPSGSTLFKNPRFADVTIKLLDGACFPAHRLVLGESPFFDAIFMNKLKKEDDKYIIEVPFQKIAPKIAELYVKAIYTGRYTLGDLKIVDFTNSEEIMCLLETGKLIFLSTLEKRISDINFELVYLNLKSIMTADISLTPRLYAFFKTHAPTTHAEYENVDFRKFRKLMIEIMEVNSHLLTMEMLEWSFVGEFTPPIIKSIIGRIPNIITATECIRKYTDKFSQNDIVNLALKLSKMDKGEDIPLLQLHRLQIFINETRVILPNILTIIVAEVINCVVLRRRLGHHIMSLLHQTNVICNDTKCLTNHTSHSTIMLIESLCPFQCKFYTLVGTVDEKSTHHWTFDIKLQQPIKITDQLMFNSRTHDISEITWMDGMPVLEGLVPEKYSIKCKDIDSHNLFELPDKKTPIYKVNQILIKYD